MNGLFEKMCKEAIEELASGDQSWRDMAPNTLILACFGMLGDRLSKKLSRPLWLFSAATTALVVTLIYRSVIG